MGKTPNPSPPSPSQDALPTTAPFPFMEDPAPAGPTAPAPTGEPEPRAEPSEEWEPPTQEQWEAEQAQRATAEENVRISREQVEQNSALMRDLLGSRPGAPAPSPEPEDPGAMPDPVRDPEGFATWLNKRDAAAEGRITQQIRTVQTGIEQNARAEQLFGEFIAKYPHLADKRIFVEAAARDAGLRPSDSKDKIFRTVTERLTRAGIQVELESPQPSGDPPPRPQRAAAPGGRAAGLPGGSGARPSRREPVEEQPQDLVDQVAADQVRLGVM